MCKIHVMLRCIYRTVLTFVMHVILKYTSAFSPACIFMFEFQVRRTDVCHSSVLLYSVIADSLGILTSMLYLHWGLSFTLVEHYDIERFMNIVPRRLLETVGNLYIFK
jgi:hypothetical protein